ncbi:transporter substrate-binding domain-containing protein [Lactococcus raffinolactis]|uniref:transporter substrate-binding domain-containing protein n=1 Tax=Pseudolactococcus raffinolactis TaxID=1366 RepID=UPI00077BF5E1|nr:transporter substrate-binding domain-containing protein [Lactococcus raffinolactis]PCS11527.1 amino acid ABC transporter substrate-binding protein [Lactococcus raffinolactis]HBZ60212.1 amino acid ABC transporter substrate-binding protein [Lactococcus sp.]
MKTYQKFIVSTFVLSATVALVACGKSTTKAEKNESSKADNVTTITVATDADTKPFTYSENNQATGYDVEVARAVFKELPEYKLKVEITDFDSVVAGVDSGRYQLAANDIGWNKDRAEKYYFSAPLSKSNNAVAVKSDLKVKTLGDLAGKSTEVLPSANFTTILSKYNDANPDKQVKLNYVDGSYPTASRLADVDSGKIDFLLYDAISLKTIIKDKGLDTLKVNNIESESTDPHDGFEYFLYTKDEKGKELQTKVDKVLKKLQSNGTLKELSEKYFGGDFVPSADAYK